MALTPGELTKVGKLVADLLARPENEDLSAEELGREVAEAIITSYEEAQSKSYNMVVLGHFRLDDDTSYVAAVGPLSTRATARARGVGERFAWDYKTRTGSGKYVLVPLIRDPHQAWDEARSHQVRAIVQANERGFSLTSDPFGPTCICGLRSTLVCPRHPEGRSDGTDHTE